MNLIKQYSPEEIKKMFDITSSELSFDDIFDELTIDGLYYASIEGTADSLNISEDEVENALILLSKKKGE